MDILKLIEEDFLSVRRIPLCAHYVSVSRADEPPRSFGHVEVTWMPDDKHFNEYCSTWSEEAKRTFYARFPDGRSMRTKNIPIEFAGKYAVTRVYDSKPTVKFSPADKYVFFGDTLEEAIGKYVDYKENRKPADSCVECAENRDDILSWLSYGA